MNEEKFKKETNTESADNSKETNSETADKSKVDSKEVTSDEASSAQDDNNKDDSESNEAITSEQLNTQELAAENASLKKEIALLKFNVKEEFKQDAQLLAENLTNNGLEFSQALSTVLDKYPQFVNSATPKLNLGGPTPGINLTRSNKDAFVSGIENSFLGGR